MDRRSYIRDQGPYGNATGFAATTALEVALIQAGEAIDMDRRAVIDMQQDGRDRERHEASMAAQRMARLSAIGAISLIPGCPSTAEHFLRGCKVKPPRPAAERARRKLGYN